jgi:hypothetical protein
MIEFDRREILLNAFLVLLSVSIVLVGFEAALRTEVITSETQYPKVRVCEDGRQTRTATGFQNDHRYGAFHPRYGWIGVPNRLKVSQHVGPSE